MNLCGRALAGQGQAIADGQQGEADPPVVANFFVEGADCPGVRVVALGIGDRAVPEHVVDGDQAPRAQQFQTGLVVGSHIARYCW